METVTQYAVMERRTSCVVIVEQFGLNKIHFLGMEYDFLDVMTYNGSIFNITYNINFASTFHFRLRSFNSVQYQF